MSQAPNILHKVPRPVVIGELHTVVDYNVTAEQIQRRERMIDFLENECPHEAFTFERVHVNDPELFHRETRRVVRAYCGTIGCAMGHAEHLFPQPGWCQTTSGNYALHAMELFGLTEPEAACAFSPETVISTDLPYAGDHATPQQVATRLREAFRRHPAPTQH